MTPLVLATWRYVVASLVLLPFVLRAPASAVPGRAPAAGALLPLGIMVLSGGVLYPWLFLAALARTSAANASLLIALNPIVTLLLSRHLEVLAAQPTTPSQRERRHHRQQQFGLQRVAHSPSPSR